MCGIVGYIGGRTAWPIIIKGLQRLEYRGYDSAGVALMDDSLHVYKCHGKVKDLDSLGRGQSISGSLGIGHTRWATHGEPNDGNAHPHTSMHGKFAVVHNGIIENYRQIKSALAANGYTFKSETDTEVLANYIESIYESSKVSAEQAVRTALSQVIGAYGLGIICTDEPRKLICARKSSPLAIGVGEGEYFVASDATPIVEYTDKLIYLEDEQVAVLTPEGINISTRCASQWSRTSTSTRAT